MTAEDVRDLVRKRIAAAGSMAALAKQWKCSTGYLSNILNGRDTPGPRILKPLGLRIVTTTTYVVESVICPDCGGSGLRPTGRRQSVKCIVCKGAGRVGLKGA